MNGGNYSAYYYCKCIFYLLKHKSEKKHKSEPCEKLKKKKILLKKKCKSIH